MASGSTNYAEDQFLLRVPPELAAKLNSALSDGGPNLDIDIDWKDNRKGTFRVGQETFQCRLQDLPTVTETWKTLDGKNLVKSGDIGQVVLVGHNLGDEKQSPHGVTLATRDAKHHLFRTPVDVPRDVVQATETKLVRMVAGVEKPQENVEVAYTEEWEDCS